ncbi:MAG: sortase B protein-sorting domain-containing protein [Phascolarctobacterium succinatutens]
MSKMGLYTSLIIISLLTLLCKLF